MKFTVGKTHSELGTHSNSPMYVGRYTKGLRPWNGHLLPTSLVKLHLCTTAAAFVMMTFCTSRATLRVRGVVHKFLPPTNVEYHRVGRIMESTNFGAAKATRPFVLLRTVLHTRCRNPHCSNVDFHSKNEPTPQKLALQNCHDNFSKELAIGIFTLEL